jgi:hypothetical protein
MNARRSFFERLEPFAPLPGLGSSLRTGEMSDSAMRAGGYQVINAAEITILKFGGREGDRVSKLMPAYARALGAERSLSTSAGGRAKASPPDPLAHLTGSGSSKPRSEGAGRVSNWSASFHRSNVRLMSTQNPHPSS